MWISQTNNAIYIQYHVFGISLSNFQLLFKRSSIVTIYYKWKCFRLFDFPNFIEKNSRNYANVCQNLTEIIQIIQIKVMIVLTEDIQKKNCQKRNNDEVFWWCKWGLWKLVISTWNVDHLTEICIAISHMYPDCKMVNFNK